MLNLSNENKNALNNVVDYLDPIMRKYKVENLYLFGSRARGTNKIDSNFNILYEHNNEDLYDFMVDNGLSDFLEEVERCPTDLDILDIDVLGDMSTATETVKNNIRKDMVKVWSVLEGKLF